MIPFAYKTVTVLIVRINVQSMGLNSSRDWVTPGDMDSFWYHQSSLLHLFSFPQQSSHQEQEQLDLLKQVAGKTQHRIVWPYPDSMTVKHMLYQPYLDPRGLFFFHCSAPSIVCSRIV